MDHQDQLLEARLIRDVAVERLLEKMQEIGADTFKAVGLSDVAVALEEACLFCKHYDETFWCGVAALSEQAA